MKPPHVSFSKRLNSRRLLAVPAAVYVLSYIYLAFYHGKWWLWNTVVHEGGTLTLLETTLYASHFLGHVPSLTIIAFIFAVWHSTFAEDAVSNRKARLGWSAAAGALLAVSLLGSLWHFGATDTWAFILQGKQSVSRNESGGSFLLHLPSTLSLFVLTPLFILAAKWMTHRKVVWRPRITGKLLYAFGVTMALAVFFTNDARLVFHALTDPRYLAHSVRELATFPLTFFPIPAAFWLATEFPADAQLPAAVRRLVLGLLGLALPLLAYQTILPLQAGLQTLAQQPAFASDSLPIPYLLASHYFEHVLDTVYFTLVCFALIPPQKLSSQRHIASSKS